MQIDKNVPMPARRYTGRTPFTLAVENALKQMEVGDSFSYEDTAKHAYLRTSVRVIAKRLGVKVTVHKVGESEYRVWKTE